MKRFFGLLLTGILLTALFFGFSGGPQVAAQDSATDVVATFQVGSSTATIDGAPVPLGFKVHVLAQGQVWGSLRPVAEAMGATVTWNDATQSATATRGDRTLTVTIGSKAAVVNGSVVALANPAHILADRTMVPLSLIAQAFGYQGELSADGTTYSFHTQPFVVINANIAYRDGVGLLQVTRGASTETLQFAPTIVFNGGPVTISATSIKALSDHIGHLHLVTVNAAGQVTAFTHVYGYLAAKSAFVTNPKFTSQAATVASYDSMADSVTVTTAGGQSVTHSLSGVPVYRLDGQRIGPDAGHTLTAGDAVTIISQGDTWLAVLLSR